MLCQVCGVEAPTRYVAFYQNIGMLVMRTHKSIACQMCKSCIHHHLWTFTTVNLFLGWWGAISFIITPFFILNNVGRYLLCLLMEPVPQDARIPELTESEVSRLQPKTQEIFERLGQKEEFSEAANDIARVTGVTPGQVARYVRAVVHSMQEQGKSQ